MTDTTESTSKMVLPTTLTLVHPLDLGKLRIHFPVIQAALSGYSDLPMQRIARQHGAEFTLSEVFLDQFVLSVSKGNKAKYYLRITDSDRPAGAQLMGNEPEYFVQAAAKMVSYGYDLVDLNFACPVKKVLGRRRGGHFLQVPKLALQIVSKVRDTLPPEIPLTLKLRKGFDDTTQSEDHFFQILDGATALGIAGITVHGRTVLQRYTGESDWNFVAKVKRHSKIPVIGSGDLFDAVTCVRRLTGRSPSEGGEELQAKEIPMDGLALARGVIGNPWLFSQVKTLLATGHLPPSPTLAEQRTVMEEHFRLSMEYYGNHRSAAVLRGIAIRYSQHHPESETVRRCFAAAKTHLDFFTVLKRFY